MKPRDTASMNLIAGNKNSENSCIMSLIYCGGVYVAPFVILLIKNLTPYNVRKKYSKSNYLYFSKADST